MISGSASGDARAATGDATDTAAAKPYWQGERITAHDAYAFTLLRWGGIAGIDPASLPGYRVYVERVMAAPPVAAALERERVKLDTYKAA